MVKFSWSVGVNGVPFYGILIHMGADWSQVAFSLIRDELHSVYSIF